MESVVRKRDNTTQPIDRAKLEQRLAALQQRFSLRVDVRSTVDAVIAGVPASVASSDLDAHVAQTCAARWIDHPDYLKLAAVVLASQMQHARPGSFADKMARLADDGVVAQELARFAQTFGAELENMIVRDRDFNFTFFALKTLDRGYLLRAADGSVVECPQDMYMRVAVALWSGAERSGAAPSAEQSSAPSAIRMIEHTYTMLSRHQYTHATPTLFNAGTNNPQLLSCFLLGMDDSIDGIYKTVSNAARISKWAGGVGVHVSGIRGQGARIRGTNGQSSGIVPMLKVVEATMRYVNQGGKRAGSAAVYLEPHHPDIMAFLELRLPTGAETERARDLFTALWVSDLFMERVRSGADWSLFDPNACPGLNTSCGQSYRNLYEQYERQGCAVATLPAMDVWVAALKSQMQTGAPYILFKDSCNAKSNQQHLGTIRSSNLCAEIVEYSDSCEYACCTLASVSLPSFIDEDDQFNFKHLGQVVRHVVRTLDRVIDLNAYPCEETRTSNLRHRPLGIGVQGLADVFMALRIPYDSDAARRLNRLIAEHMYYAAVDESVEMAREHGRHVTFAGSPASRGLLQPHMWHTCDPQGIGEGIDGLNFDDLAQSVKAHGMRHSLLIALMPTATTSIILGNTDSFEPPASLIGKRRTLAGEFVNVVPALADALCSDGLWTPAVVDYIVTHDGSVVGAPGVPKDLQSVFKTVWEIPLKLQIDMAAARGPYVCQSQSLNLYLSAPSIERLTAALFYAWTSGLKTGVYYVRTRPEARAMTVRAVAEDSEAQDRAQCSGDICTACSA